MKGVIAQISPKTPLIDLTHQIPPGDIRRAALMLWQSVDYFPAGSVFLVVVDPGVGTARRAMITQVQSKLFIGPDNGVFSFLLPPQAPAWELADPQYQLPTPGTTFHGRDIFSPAAAHTAKGVPPASFGPRIPDPVRLPAPRLESSPEGGLRGEILHADQFGNLLTSLGRFSPKSADQWQFSPWVGNAPGQIMAPQQYRVKLPSGESLPWATTFEQIPSGGCAALIGSTGLIEIAANLASAADLLQLGGGDPISIVPITT